MSDPVEAAAPARRETGLSHWRRELGQCAAAALLVDERLEVLEINLAARELGIEPAQRFGAWMQALQAHARQRGGPGDEVCVTYVPVQFKDFRGWFVTPCGSETAGKARLVEALERKLEDAKRRLAAEIRRRQFLERQILLLTDGERRTQADEVAPDGVAQS